MREPLDDLTVARIREMIAPHEPCTDTECAAEFQRVFCEHASTIHHLLGHVTALRTENERLREELKAEKEFSRKIQFERRHENYLQDERRHDCVHVNERSRRLLDDNNRLRVELKAAGLHHAKLARRIGTQRGKLRELRAANRVYARLTTSTDTKERNKEGMDEQSPEPSDIR